MKFFRYSYAFTGIRDTVVRTSGRSSGSCGTRSQILNIMTTCSTILFSTHAVYLFDALVSGNSHGCFDICATTTAKTIELNRHKNDSSAYKA